MRIAVLGTGMVGQEIGSRLISKGHSVKMGSRTSNNENATNWAKENGPEAQHGTFSEAAIFAEELIINCTKGAYVLDVLKQAGNDNMAGKVLLDISNPLDFSKGMPPTLSIVNDNSLGEEIQKLFPESKVVKALNTMSHKIMLNPSLVPGKHNAFVSGNDEKAKTLVKELLNSFDWESDNIIDLGDISTARGTEMLLPIWLRLWGALGTSDFNFYIQK